MKGNEARVVFYLHPVDQVKDGRVVRVGEWASGWSRLVQGARRLTGRPPEEKMLLHTLPYYLAITRSSCEVG